MFTFAHSVRTAANLREGAILCRHASTSGMQIDVSPKETDVGLMSLVGDTISAQGDYLRTLVWANGNGMMVATAGIAGSGDSFAFLQGSRHPVNVRAIDGMVNALIARKAEAVYDYTVATVNPTTPRVAFFGHSAGGAVACLLSAMYSRRRPQAVMRCANYGQPRFADYRFYNAHREACQARIMNNADAFCLLVPHSGESAAWQLLSSPSDLSRINTMDDGPNGIVIEATGDLRESSLPTGAVIPGPGDMLTAWSNPNSALRSAHAISSYVDALTSRAISQPTALPIRGPAVTVVTRPPSQDSQATMAAAQVQTLRAMAAAQPGSWTPPRRSFIRYRRSGRLWIVTAGDMQVYVASTKNDARAVARILSQLYVQFWQRPFAFTTPEMLATLVLSTPPLGIPP